MAVKFSRVLRVVVTDAVGRPVPADGLDRWLARVAPTSVRGEVVVALVSDTKIRALNRRFRGRNQVTDVLSFSAEGEVTRPRSCPRLLGDVVIAKGQAVRQARKIGHGIRVEFRRLALHGLLHLLGYDHEQDDGKMARLEQRLLRKGGISKEVL